MAKKWSDEEITALKEYYPEFGGVYLEKHNIVNRASKAISNKAATLGIKFSNITVSEEPTIKWVDEEIKILEKEYPIRGPSALFNTGLLPNRTEKSIRIKASRLGLQFFSNDGLEESTLYIILIEFANTTRCLKVGVTTRDMSYRLGSLRYDIGYENIIQSNIVYNYKGTGSSIKDLEKRILSSSDIVRFYHTEEFPGSTELISIWSLGKVFEIIDGSNNG